MYPNARLWNTSAPDKYALPTEIWREVVARRGQYEAVRAKLSNGEIDDINALITDNLDIRQFAHDVIENCEGPELLRAFWKAITRVTILDPTCGSGAFLFAALNILEPLYEACLDRMQVFIDELQYAVKTPHPRKFSDFREVLEHIEQHPNRRYFILKSIIIKNLYGVDIMEEAIEICKLRLFLKMVAQIEDVRQIEPLPDIDFNIQAGNTLVGYATYNEVEKAVTEKLDFDNTMTRIKEGAEDVKQLFDRFREQQTELGGAVTPDDKQALRDKLKVLEDELNRYLAGEYGVDPNKGSAYQNWLSSHKPFHWFIEFYGILKDGGFDVIIGNPPYVEYSKVKKEYAIKGYDTESCGNLYAFVFERSFHLLQQNGWKSMIIPHSAYCTDRMSSLQDLFHRSRRVGWVQTYSIRPAKLFVGADQRLAIYIVQQGSKLSHSLYSSRYHRWNERFRSHLFAAMEHIDITQISFQNSLPKIYCGIEQSIWKKLAQFPVLGTCLATSRTSYTIYFHNSPRYWIRAMDFAPYFWNERDGEGISTQVKPLYVQQIVGGAVAGLQGELAHRYPAAGVQVDGVGVLHRPSCQLQQVIYVHTCLFFRSHGSQRTTPLRHPYSNYWQHESTLCQASATIALTGSANHDGITARVAANSSMSSGESLCPSVSRFSSTSSGPSQARARTASPAGRCGATSCHRGAWRSSTASPPSFSLRLGPDVT